MGIEYLLTAAPWARIAPLLAGLTRRVGQLAYDVHPFQRWARSGVWPRVLAAVQQDNALHTLLDSTTVRAHQHAAGARKKTGRKP